MTEIIDLRNRKYTTYPKNANEVCQRFNMKPYGIVYDADIVYVVCYDIDRVAIVKCYERVVRKENQVEQSYYIKTVLVIMSRVYNDVLELLCKVRNKLQYKQRTKILLEGD